MSDTGSDCHVAARNQLHTKRSMFVALLSELGMREDQAVYLDDTGHMSAGTGYPWAATVVRSGAG